MIRSINGVLKSTTTPGQSEPGSNGHEGIFHVHQSFRTEASQLDGCVISRTLIGRGFTNLAEMQLIHLTALAY